MALQLRSGFATEGTQYATDSSYYLLDTVPGSGSVIVGPVTVSGNLVVTGTETVQGALAVASNITAPSLSAPPTQATPLIITGSLNGTTLTLPSNAPGPVVVSHPVGASITLSSNDNIDLASSTGNITLTTNLAQSRLISGAASVLVGPAGVSMNSTAGQMSLANALPPFIGPSLTCPSYRNSGSNQGGSISRTGPGIFGGAGGPFQPLPIQNVGSAQVTLPVAPLFANNVVPQLVKITITNLRFRQIGGGSCSPSAPFTIYFYQGTSTDYNEISAKALCTYVYTNQTGTLAVPPPGGTINVTPVTLPFINAGQLNPTGPPIAVWYYTYFDGNIDPDPGVVTTFSIAPVL